MKTDWKDIESVEVALERVNRIQDIAECELDSTLRDYRNKVVENKDVKSAALALHVHAKSMLALLRFVLENTSAMEQLTEIKNKAEELLSAEKAA